MAKLDISTLGLGIVVPFITKEATNFKLNSWPPEPDFPVITDKDGNVVSRYGDSIWYLWPWTKTPSSLNFSDGETRKLVKKISKENADIFRAVIAWWLYGPGSVSSPKSLLKYFTDIKPIFICCTTAGILVTDLYRYPLVLDEIIKAIPSSSVDKVCFLLHSLYSWREELGFEILPPSTIAIIFKSFSRHVSNQTPYIPARIWTYQVQRLSECFDDFLAHKEKIESCFNFCVETYSHHYGTFESSFEGARKRSRGRTPFSKESRPENRLHPNHQFESFQAVADHYGITNLIHKWVTQGVPRKDGLEISISAFSKYFTLIGYAGIAYILNFSMMRIQEAWNLRANCLEVEDDILFGRIYLLNGVTTKTIDDADAKWVTSASIRPAIEAMTIVSKLRMSCAIANPSIDVPKEYIEHPWLVVRNYEPWSSSYDAVGSVAIRHSYPSYADVVKCFDGLYDQSEMAITTEDLDSSRQITGGLDEIKYRLGTPWALAWHQLRRTGAVNMQGSDLVSLPSMQYQLKHATRAMSLYYGRGYSTARINSSAREEYVRTMYEMLAKDLLAVSSDRFVSPYGDSRKSQLVERINVLTPTELEKALRKGMFSWRPTVLGGCTKRGPCPYGGLDNIAHCGGGDGFSPCVDALFDTNKKDKFIALSNLLDTRLAAAPHSSPLFKSLKAQKLALEKTLNVIESK